MKDKQCHSSRASLHLYYVSSPQTELLLLEHNIMLLQEAMRSPLCDTLYVTEVLAEFEADTFFPPIDTSVYQLVK